MSSVIPEQRSLGLRAIRARELGKERVENCLVTGSVDGENSSTAEFAIRAAAAFRGGSVNQPTRPRNYARLRQHSVFAIMGESVEHRCFTARIDTENGSTAVRRITRCVPAKTGHAV